MQPFVQKKSRWLLAGSALVVLFFAWTFADIGPAFAATNTGLLACTGTDTTTYDPGITNTSRTVEFTDTGQVICPVNLASVTAITLAASGSETASCTEVTSTSYNEEATYTFSNSSQTQSSTYHFTSSEVIKEADGTTEFISTGTVSAGVDEGYTVVQADVISNLNLQACFTQGGLQSNSGASVLTLTPPL